MARVKRISLGMASSSSPEQPKRISRFFTEYYAAAVLGVIALTIVLAMVFLRPHILTIKEINAQTESQLVLISRERAYLASLDQSVAAAQSIQPTTLDQVHRALPNDPQIPSILVQFGSAALRHNVRIDALTFSQTHVVAPAAKQASSTASSIVPLDVNLVLRARNYFDVKRFLADVESSLRLMDVTGIAASGIGNELSYALQLRTYSFAPLERRAPLRP